MRARDLPNYSLEVEVSHVGVTASRQLTYKIIDKRIHEHNFN